MVHLIFLLEVLMAINFTREFNSNVHECCFNKDQNKLVKWNRENAMSEQNNGQGCKRAELCRVVHVQA